MPLATVPGGRLRVLHIEDDPAAAVLIRRALERRGLVVTRARDGNEGLDLLASAPFDAIALDHELPGETGLAVLARLGARTTRPPVVYVTASADARLAVEALKSGADDYVVKDMSPDFHDLLFAALLHVHEQRRLERLRDEAERAILVARDRAEMLLNEVDHRVANSLGLVAAMVRMQAAVVTDPVAVRALSETQGRISAVAGVHRHLHTASRTGAVAIDVHLARLVEDVATSMRGSGADHVVEFVADRVVVPTDAAVSLAIIVGELITNAFKYAYEPGDRGIIRVTVEARSTSRCRITVADDGRGFDTRRPAEGTGLGSRIVAAMARDLDAELTHDRTCAGTRIVVDFPVVAPETVI